MNKGGDDVWLSRKRSNRSRRLRPEDVAEEQSLLDQIIEDGRMARDESQRECARDLIGEFVKQVMEGAMVVSKDTELMINARIAQIDRLISAQLNEIMHHPDFQKLEASWRGLSYLVEQSETGETTEDPGDERHQEGAAQGHGEGGRVRPVDPVQEDLRGGVRHVRRRVLRRPDRRLRVRQPSPGPVTPGKDVRRWRPPPMRPFISAASPAMFNLESFTELGKPRDLAKIFQSVEYAKWKSFRDSEDSRYVALCPPAHPDAAALRPGERCPVETFNFEEDVDGTDHSKYLWGNAAYALGTRLTDAFAKYRLEGGHPGRRGRRPGAGAAGPYLQDRRRRRGPQVPDGDRHHRPAREGTGRPRLHPPRPLQGHRLRGLLQHPDRQQAEGLRHATQPTPMPGCRPSSSTSWRSRRFAHYLKSIMRDKIGSFMTRKNVEDLPEPLDQQLCPPGRRCRTGDEGAAFPCVRRGSM